jgi:uncharacterized protein (TIGR03435 family)
MATLRAILPAVLLACACAVSAQTFEVASVKLAQAGSTPRVSGGPLGSGSPGQFNATAMPLRVLLFSYAHQLYGYRYAAPAWIENQRYDVAAKVPPGTTREQFEAMLWNLLIERFKITFHHEQREMTVYDLVVDKSGLKMKPSAADEKSQASPRIEWGADGFPPIPTGTAHSTIMTQAKGQMVLATNKYSMAQLADTLSGWLGHSVFDKTELTGDYAFVLHFAFLVPQTSDAPDGNAAVDPAPTAFEAVQSQLGLKLEPRKAPVDVLVIDHAEKAPIED